MKKIRVLHVIDSLDLGGAQEALQNLVHFGDSDRFHFEVASMHRHGIYSARIAALGVKVHALSPHKFLPFYIPNLVRLLIFGRYNIVHCHLTWANLIAKPLARLCGVKLLFNHDQTNEAFRHSGGLRFEWDKLANRLSTRTFAVSASIQNFLIESENLPREQVSLVYNGINPNRFPLRASVNPAIRRPWGFGPEHFVVAGVGRLHPQKNFSLFLKVAKAALARDASLRFIIAGEGALRTRLEDEIQMLGLFEHVRLLGFIADTAQLFPGIDLLMMTSDYEGLPLTLLEAMSVGVPTVASAVDGIQEIIEPGVDGLLAAPGNEEAFVTALLHLRSSPALQKQIVDAASQKVQSTFTASRMAALVESLYNDGLRGV